MSKILGVIMALGLFLGLITSTSLVLAQEETESLTRQVEILSLDGTASILRAGSGEWITAVEGDILMSGDTLQTGPMSSVELNFDGSAQTAVVKVSENAELVFSKLSQDKATDAKETLLDLAIGSILIKASKLEAESKFEVNTPTSIVGVRGTTFEVRVSAAE